MVVACEDDENGGVDNVNNDGYTIEIILECNYKNCIKKFVKIESEPFILN